MGQYRLDFLNHREFEILTCDLLSSLWEVRIENFKPGRDQGVDGRFYEKDGSETIIQCKHYERSGYAKLLFVLKNDELPKIRRLNPNRYILVVSVPLSRENKAELIELFTPFIQRDDDVFGLEDIQSLLEKYPSVVQGHYKLWFSGTEVLRLITTAAIIGRSQYTIAEIQASLPKYVFTSAYQKAIEKLELLRVIVITGSPGVGKTTLAKQLVLWYLANGYELVHIAHNLAEAETVLNRDKKQIFYFDDFLGGNYLELFQDAKDSQILSFISRISHTPNKRFILTSRTVILNRAKSISQYFDHANITKQEFEIKADNLSRVERARILYNHLWLSSLSHEYIAELLKNRRYREIIEHRGYGPRLIDFVTDSARVGDIQPIEYWNYIVKNLSNPKDIWRGVYENQLDPQSRWVLCAVVFNGGEISESKLQDSFNATFVSASSAGPIEVGIKFNNAVRLTTNSVLRRTLSRDEESPELSLWDPSIGDFVIHHYANDVNTLTDLLVKLQTIECLTRLYHLSVFRSISKNAFDEVIDRLVAAASKLSPAFRLRLSGVMGCETLQENYPAFLQNCLNELPSFLSVMNSHKLLAQDVVDLLFTGRMSRYFNEREGQLVSYIKDILNQPLKLDEYKTLSSVVDVLSSYDHPDVFENFKSKTISHLCQNIDWLVEDRDVLYGYRSYIEQKEEAERAVVKFINGLLMDFYIQFEPGLAGAVFEACNIKDIIGRSVESEEKGQRLVASGVRGQSTDDEIEIDSLFDLGILNREKSRSVNNC